MSFKSWLHNDFLKEDAEFSAIDALDDEAPVQQKQMPAEVNREAGVVDAGGAFKKYFSDTNLTKSLSKLGDELGEALFNFAVKDFVTADMFNSADDQLKYEMAIRNKVAEDYNKKLIEVLVNAGKFIENTKRSITKV